MPGALISRSIAAHCLHVALNGKRGGGAANIPQHHTKTERQHHPRCRLGQWNGSRNDAVLRQQSASPALVQQTRYSLVDSSAHR